MVRTVKGARRTQEQRRLEARSRLLQAAAELIAEGGLAAVTLAAVGHRAGYSRSVATHHFANKAGLISSLIDQVEAEFVAATAPVGALDTSVDELVETASIFLRLLVNPAAIHKSFLVLWAEAVADADWQPRIRASDDEFRLRVRAAVERGQARGEVDPILDTATTAIAFIGLLRGIALQELLSPSEIDLAATSRTVEVWLRRALSIKPGT